MIKTNSNQIYKLGETPVYVAYIERNGTPLLPEHFDFDRGDYIRVTHSEQRIGIKNGMAMKDWFPVNLDTGSPLDKIEVSSEIIFDPIVPAAESDVYEYITVTEEFDYNLLYIPLNGDQFYQKVGPYRTIIHLQYTISDQQYNDILTFESKAIAPNIVLEPLEPIPFGEPIPFVGTIYTKIKQQDGKFLFPEEANEKIGTVYLTVSDRTESPTWNAVSNQIYIDRENIGPEVILDAVTDNFKYTFQSERLRKVGINRPGIYRFKFEIEAKDVIATDPILCTFEIDVKLI